MTQTVSILMVTLGVIFTTSSASKKSAAHDPSSGQYMTGILLLSIALILSGFLGVVQDHAYSQYRIQGGSPWRESMFYLHFLSLPMFIFARENITNQLKTLNASPHFVLNYGIPCTLPVPTSFLLLVLNVLTQLFCVAGVNRLTSRVSSLTVTLVLVIRKAASLMISVMLFGSHDMDWSDKLLLWGGATLVFAGSIMYSMPNRQIDGKKNR
jgi:solute carrier family 35 (UDP-xylose/UDP-N-acetylglucosamine transporter), member B4